MESRTSREYSPAGGVLAACIAAALIFLAGTAFAHHGWGGYKEVTEMTATVTELKLGNPHDRLIAVDGEGAEWNLLLAPPARNRRFGFSEESVSAGDEPADPFEASDVGYTGSGASP